MMMKKDPAVSPVIGVLLMLTLTLIIVAIVNSYAGGLMNTESKPPAVTLHVVFHNETGMQIQEVSGDPFPTSQVRVIIKPSETMGRGAGQHASIIEKSSITNLNGTLSWDSGLTSLKPGEIAYILPGKLPGLQTGIDDAYLVTNPKNKGNTFFLELYYKNSMISRSEVLIE
jgi:FlaG/FlaF family flagellin (archaellin)